MGHFIEKGQRETRSSHWFHSEAPRIASAAYDRDLDLTAKDVTELASPDAITALLSKLGYDAGGTASRWLHCPSPASVVNERQSKLP